MTSTAAIGPATEEDLTGLAALMRETIQPLACYNERARGAELAKYTAESLRALAAGDRHALLVARDDTGLVGFCVSRFDGGTIFLDWYGTAERARGRGIGAALLAALSAGVPERNAHKIWCDSRTDNTASNTVLERAGYRRIATLTNHWFEQDYFLWECYP